MKWLGEEKRGTQDGPGEAMFRRGGALQGEACSSQMPGSAVRVSAREQPSEGRYKSPCIISHVCADECAKGATQKEEISH